VLPALAAAVVCAYGRAEVVVGEYSNHYHRGFDYVVFVPSTIVIHNYDEGYPYDFDAFDDSTPEPHTPATI
jgi:hypothetical protein